MLSCDNVQKLIEEGIPDSSVQVFDMTGTSDHFSVRVVSPAFEGKSLLEQHRMVNESVKEYLTKEIHALQIKTLTPDQV